MPRSAAVAVVAAAVGLLAVGWYWAYRSATEPAAQPTPAPPVQLRAEQARIVIRHRGDPQVDLRSRQVEVSADLQRATFEGVDRATVFREGREFLYIRAQRIVLNRQSQNFVATGGVEVTSPDGDWLRAPYMVYINERAVLAFPRGVAFQLGNNRAQAKSLRFFILQQTVEMEGGVDVTLDIRSLPTPRP
ncbi:MAG: LPS export ABC transporter periplasmic protein LptC [Armatimonadota bacterium]|nr:LPS export ABC transporter periplasmic protein LptC [Armatimonadota bacterium]MDR5696924.1 LPS export ABC transporter periplasmic protein LptC [Armatimonadota bacterium]